jgi:hypothetical protein
MCCGVLPQSGKEDAAAAAAVEDDDYDDSPPHGKSISHESGLHFTPDPLSLTDAAAPRDSRGWTDFTDRLTFQGLVRRILSSDVILISSPSLTFCSRFLCSCDQLLKLQSPSSTNSSQQET